MAVDAASSQVLALEGITTTSSTSSTESRIESQSLGQDDFFKLLTTQLASQDPMNPMEDTAFIAQMASFSQLEMTSSMTKSLDSFTDSQSFTAAQGYIGKIVSLSTGEIGEVTSVERQDGQTIVFLDGDDYNGRDIDTIYRVDVKTDDTTVSSSRQVSNTDSAEDTEDSSDG